jgi:hypothetical protein
VNASIAAAKPLIDRNKNPMAVLRHAVRRACEAPRCSEQWPVLIFRNARRCGDRLPRFAAISSGFLPNETTADYRQRLIAAEIHLSRRYVGGFRHALLYSPFT